jgi:hypothetical protein
MTKGKTYTSEQMARKRERDCKRRAEWKKKVFDHYGRRGSCCGEDHIEFLSIDHITGHGNQQRKDFGTHIVLYHWLVNNGFPEGYQVLCMNCNHAKGKNGGDGLCPHERERNQLKLFA